MFESVEHWVAGHREANTHFNNDPLLMKIRLWKNNFNI